MFGDVQHADLSWVYSMKGLDKGCPEWFWYDDLFVIAHNSVDDVEMVPAIIIVGVNPLKVFWGSPYQGVSDSSQQGVLHCHDGDRMLSHQVVYGICKLDLQLRCHPEKKTKNKTYLGGL